MRAPMIPKENQGARMRQYHKFALKILGIIQRSKKE